MRGKVLDAVDDVTLLPSEKVPVFGDAGTMVAELGFAIFLSRSAGTWGISSRISGPFDTNKYETLTDTCGRIIAFLLGSSSHRSSSSSHHQQGAEGESEMPSRRSQDILRAANVETILFAALDIDYNLAFKGSICSNEDRVTSRRMIVRVQRALFRIMRLWVM